MGLLSCEKSSELLVSISDFPTSWDELNINSRSYSELIHRDKLPTMEVVNTQLISDGIT